MAKGLKESKKFAIGSIHENGGGKFEILERWFDEESNAIMLRYRYEDGRIESNKEVNVNASEWKWRKVRGLVGKSDNNSGECPCETTMEEYFEGLYEMSETHARNCTENADRIIETINENQKFLMELVTLVQVQQKQIESLINDRSLIEKLLEKI